MGQSTGRSTRAAVPGLVLAALLAAPAGALDDEERWPELSERDLALVDCMVGNEDECNDEALDKLNKDPTLWPTEQGWVRSAETKLYPFPALTGRSPAEIFRDYATRKSPGTFGEHAGTRSE